MGEVVSYYLGLSWYLVVLSIGKGLMPQTKFERKEKHKIS